MHHILNPPEKGSFLGLSSSTGGICPLSHFSFVKRNSQRDGRGVFLFSFTSFPSYTPGLRKDPVSSVQLEVLCCFFFLHDETASSLLELGQGVFAAQMRVFLSLSHGDGPKSRENSHKEVKLLHLVVDCEGDCLDGRCFPHHLPLRLGFG